MRTLAGCYVYCALMRVNIHPDDMTTRTQIGRMNGRLTVLGPIHLIGICRVLLRMGHAFGRCHRDVPTLGSPDVLGTDRLMGSIP
jgi:hypothetical protein